MTDPTPSAPNTPPATVPAVPAALPRSPDPVPAPKKASPAPPSPHEIRFGSYPLFTLFWPLVVVGEIAALLLKWHPEWDESLGWVYLTAMLTCFTAVGFDVRRNLAIGWALFVALCWVGGLYLKEAKQIPVLGAIRDFLAGLDAKVTPGFMHAVSLLVGVGIVGVFINVMLNHRWRVTHNELHSVRRGELDDAITRGSKRISVEFPDMFELLLLGSGHVVVRDSRGKDEIRRIPRVPLLVFRRKKLDRIAEVWAVATTPEPAGEGDDDDN